MRSLRQLFLATWWVALLWCPSAFAEYCQWTGPAAGIWNDPANWNPAHVPGPGDEADIPGGNYAVAIDSTVSIGGLTVQGGSSVSVGSGAELNIMGDVQLYGLLSNVGTVRWLAGNITVDYRSHQGFTGGIQNGPGAVFDIRCDRTMLTPLSSENPQFQNQGMLRKSAGTGTSSINIALTNSGTVEALTGTLAFGGGGSLGGTLQAVTGTSIYLAGGGFVLVPGVQFTGPGQVGVNGSPALSGTLVTTLNCYGGLLDEGTDLTVGTGGVFNILGNLQVYGPLANLGTIRWLGGDITVQKHPVNGWTGGIDNRAGGVFDIQCDQAMRTDYAAESPRFQNAGTLRKSAGAGVSSINILLDNNNTVEALAGTLAFGGGGSLAGTLQATGGTSVYLAGGGFTLSPGVQFTGPGLVGVNGSPALTGTLTTTLNCYGGSLAAGTHLTVGTAGVFKIEGDLQIYGLLVNDGAIRWLAGEITVRKHGSSGWTGGIDNRAGGVFDIQCDQTLRTDDAAENPEFQNAGTLRKSAGTGASRIDIALANTGMVETLSGSLVFGGGGGLGGTLQAAAGTSVYLAGGGFSVSPGVQFGGPGLVGVNGSPVLTGTLTTALNCYGGSLAAGTLLTVGTGGVFIIQGDLELYGLLVNEGEIRWLAGDITVQKHDINGWTGGIDNHAGGVFDIQCDQTMRTAYAVGNPEFQNAGTLRKSAGTGTSRINIALANSGTVEALTGKLAFGGGGSVGGILQAAAGMAVELSGGSFELMASAQFQGQVGVSGSPVLTGTLSTTLDCNEGSLAAGTHLTIGASGVFKIDGDLQIYGLLANEGTIRWLAGEITVQKHDANGWTGAIDNRAGGVFSIECDQTMGTDHAAENPKFENTGVLRKTAGTGTSHINIALHNSSTVEALTGILAFGADYSGPIGASLGGKSAGVDYGRVVFERVPIFSGPFVLTLRNGYVPEPGATFEILSYPSAAGDFSHFAGVDLGGGLRLDPGFEGAGMFLSTVLQPLESMPRLTVLRTISGIVLSWPIEFDDWELFGSEDLITWEPASVAGTNNTVVPAILPCAFFRLEGQP